MCAICGADTCGITLLKEMCDGKQMAMLALWHWHIEISSKCTLRCPRCTRQEVTEGLVNKELRLPFFRKNFTPKFINEHVEKITFCGDDGDPIYAHDLVPVIAYLKSVKPEVQIVIVTNGSYKRPDWWEKLGAVLDTRDHVHFSVDGWDQESNDQYRVNSDWDSIVSGIQHLRKSSDCYMTWAAIAFSFNQDQLHVMKSMAHELGMDQFQITKSTKFGSIYPSYGSNDELEPAAELVSSSLRFERDITNLSGRVCPDDKQKAAALFKAAEQRAGDMIPLCDIGNKGMYINSRGQLFPCCWVANRYKHNDEWNNRARSFDLNNSSLTDVLLEPFWEGELRSFRWMECKTKCSRAVVDLEYASNW